MSLQDDDGHWKKHESDQSFDKILNISWEMMELTVPREKWKEEMARRLGVPFDALQRVQVTDSIAFGMLERCCFSLSFQLVCVCVCVRKKKTKCQSN
jgi:hypothetical protein